MDNPRLFYPWAATGQHHHGQPGQHIAQSPPTLLQAAYYPTRKVRNDINIFFSFFFAPRNELFIYNVIQFNSTPAADNIQTCSGAAI